jgi:hypothetical protein
MKRTVDVKRLERRFDGVVNGWIERGGRTPLLPVVHAEGLTHGRSAPPGEAAPDVH